MASQTHAIGHRRRQSRARRSAGGDALDPGEIFASVGEVAYVWHLDSDRLTWGANATASWSSATAR